EGVINNMVFQDYSNYYDLLYANKDYHEECNFIKSIFDKYSKKEINTILDFGCGTGTHALIFSDMGYTVTGVDLSQRMLQLAIRKAEKQNKQTKFLKGDIRHLDIQKQFDAIVAMFNVLGYQTTNKDVENTIRTVRHHMNLDGLFICDLWFGPVVLSEKPTERVKSIEQGNDRIVRYARPVIDVLRHTVEVNYTISEIRDGKETIMVKESHLVRFFFYQELLCFMEKNGFRVLQICPFMDLDGHVDEHCWNVSVISKAI
ncbi:class I SAM-dependent DNA methyltransferase, partial [Chloroflexota bacterium]